MQQNICSGCGKEIVSKGFTSGYGIASDGRKVCYACCGKRDREELLSTGKFTGYLFYDPEPGIAFKTGWRDVTNGRFTNWPSTLSIPVARVKRSFNNFGAMREDFYFSFEGSEYWGVCVGTNTQIARVKKIKGGRK